MIFKVSLRISLAALAVMAFSCGGQEVLTDTTALDASVADKETKSVGQLSENPAYLQGLALIKENDCPNCHTQSSKMIGPSYVEIASKYDNTAATRSLLATRIISGSVGVWGEIPMTAHPSLSQDKVEQMINYILLLKD